MSPALQADSLPPEPPGKLGGEQKEKGATEDEVVGWYRGLNEHEFEQYMGDSEWQRSPVLYSPWGHGLDLVTEQQQSLYLLKKQL